MNRLEAYRLLAGLRKGQVVTLTCWGGVLTVTVQRELRPDDPGLDRVIVGYGPRFNIEVTPAGLEAGYYQLEVDPDPSPAPDAATSEPAVDDATGPTHPSDVQQRAGEPSVNLDAVGCPCGAQPGERCVTPAGAPMPWIHQPRVDAARAARTRPTIGAYPAGAFSRLRAAIEEVGEPAPAQPDADVADVLMDALIEGAPSGALWIHTEDLHPLRKHLAKALAPLLAAREQAARAEAWDEAIQAAAWCLDNGEPSAAAALAYVAENNPHRRRPEAS